MFSKFQEWYIEGKHTDIKIVFKGPNNSLGGNKQNIIHAHKAVIGSQSPELERMVYDDQLKSQGRESLLVLQNDDNFDNFKLMLEYLYEFPITPQTIVPIFNASIKYQVWFSLTILFFLQLLHFFLVKSSRAITPVHVQ